jgi:hypothetical protein
MKMKIECPYCDNSFVAKRGSRTQSVYCTKCYSMFVIPARPIVETVAITLMVSAMFSLFLATYTAGKSNVLERSTWNGGGSGMMKGEKKSHLDLKYVPPMDPMATDFRQHKFQTIDTIYTDAVEFGELKPGQVRPADIGKTVIWRGLLIEQGFSEKHKKVYVKFQHKAGGKANVMVYLNDNHPGWVEGLRVGAYVTYSGVLDVSAYGDKEHILVSGSIISVDQF